MNFNHKRLPEDSGSRVVGVSRLSTKFTNNFSRLSTKCVNIIFFFSLWEEVLFYVTNRVVYSNKYCSAKISKAAHKSSKRWGMGKLISNLHLCGCRKIGYFVISYFWDIGGSHSFIAFLSAKNNIKV